MKNNKRSKFAGFWAGKGFYIVSAICLVAIGVAAWSAFDALKDFPKSNKDQSSRQMSSYQSKAPDTSSKTPTVSETENTNSVVSEEPPIKESGTGAPPVATFFITPISGATVYKNFSDTELQYSNTYNDYRLHAAVDLVSKTATNVTACGDGIVTDITTDGLLGTVVTIDHGNNIVARYCGLKEAVTVKKGDIVTSTTVIGAVGTVPSESLDEAHLHLEFLKDGKPVSPLDLFS